MFRIKICGVTSIADALMVAAAGADAIGLNFYPGSPRFVTLETARAIVSELPRQVIKVGLFVNSPAAEVAEAFDGVGLDLVQLHGDEPPDFLTQLEGRPAMKAFRLGPGGLSPVTEYLRLCRAAGCCPSLCLVDAFVPGRYGGTGQSADWGLLQHYPVEPWVPPLVLAGGLTPENVAGAVRKVHPFAVDVSSGVEQAKGIKDADKISAFIEAVRKA